MNYPVWQLDFAGGGLLIALMATIHVYIAQFAVGGGLFLVLTEMKGLKEKNRAIVDYVSRHSRFFVLVTMVFGALTGVGIWFTISLLDPAATSKLIHIFLFAWAIEWLFFLTEIISLFIYYKTFDKVSEKTHLMVGWVYAISAILSLFFINGIIDFMLTPGAWLENGNFWSGFFNPTFWPAFFFRLFLSLMIAGLFGFITSSWLKDESIRVNMLRYCSKWVVAPFLLFIGAAFWYKSSLPPQLESFVFELIPSIEIFVLNFIIFAIIVLVGGALMAVKMPPIISRAVACLMLAVGLVLLGSFEFIREGGRKPYVIHGYMYSNSILKSEVVKVSQNGVLKSARWVKNKEITDENLVEAGQEIFNILCLSCHSIGGPIGDIKKFSGRLSSKEMAMVYDSMGQGRAYMPPFVGTAEEQKALNAFLTYGM